MRTFNHITNRIVRDVIEKFNIPPSYFNYKYIKSETPRDYLKRTNQYASNCKIIDSDFMFHAPLPCNVNTRQQLSKISDKWGYAFYDVPERRVSGTYVVKIPNCRIISYRNQWDDEFYAIVTDDNRNLILSGNGFNSEHAKILKESKTKSYLHKASWILEFWATNYFHWLVFHLPKILLLQEYGLSENILLLQVDKGFPFIRSSVELLGISYSQLPRLNSSIVHVDELTVIELDHFHPDIMHRLRKKLIHDISIKPYRKVFISRQNSYKRCLENESEIWNILQTYGFERVFMEELAFQEQISLMLETNIVFGLHGAGLTNMLFLSPGSHIVEIVDPDYPCPYYYTLANILGHRYWLINGIHVGKSNPGVQDILIKPEVVEEIINRIEKFNN